MKRLLGTVEDSIDVDSKMYVQPYFNVSSGSYAVPFAEADGK